MSKGNSRKEPAGGIATNRLDALDRFAAAMSEFSPRSLGGTQYDFEDILTEAMINSVNVVTWQQNSCEALVGLRIIARGSAGARGLGWGEKLKVLLSANGYGEEECLAAGVSKEDRLLAIETVVHEFWNERLHRQMLSFYKEMDRDGARFIAEKVLQGREPAPVETPATEEEVEHLFGTESGSEAHHRELDEIVRQQLNPEIGSW